MYVSRGVTGSRSSSHTHLSDNLPKGITRKSVMMEKDVGTPRNFRGAALPPRTVTASS